MINLGVGTLLLIAIAGLVLLGLLGWGFFLLLVQLGVIVNEARKPAYRDTGNYSLSQGHDVGKEEQ
ncbi:MAG: hypothetical protein ACLFVO_08635 [Chloroflexaceae bacterium]